MSKTLMIVLGVVGVILLLVFIVIGWGVGIYNGFVGRDEAVKSAWGQVENQYQRRADLIPNIVETVRGYAKHEKETLEGVINARAKATQVTVSPGVYKDPKAFEQFQATQDQFGQAIGRLMVVVEKYPDLKANENFLTLQSQLEGTENRIAVERKRFNDVVQDYNTAIRRYPGAMIANFAGFREAYYFKAQAGSDQAPKVKF
jgi:LemA protein